jgi:RNA polymerase sigma factor (sigma-70 family)
MNASCTANVDPAVHWRQHAMTFFATSPIQLESSQYRVWPSPFIHDIERPVPYRMGCEQQSEYVRLTESTGLEAVLADNRAVLARFVRARLRKNEAVEDVLQELWLNVQSVDSGPIAEPLAYLYRMADNLVLDRKRADQRRLARDYHWSECRANGDDLTADAAPTPERIVLARDYLRRVDARLALLPERTVFVFRAVRIDRRPQKDLATELGISLSAVEKHLQRAYREIVSVKEELERDTIAPHRRIAGGVSHDAG